MGNIVFSMPRELVLKFKEKGAIENFVETGTYKGGTSFWAAEHFKQVYTIEIDPNISAATKANPKCPSNIQFYVGNSKDRLPEIVPELKGRSLFWLDGHWCNVSSFGKEDECPVLEEIIAVSQLKDPVILIDDCRAFLGPLPPPHDNDKWPRIDEIIVLLKHYFPESLCTICDDVIYCIPKDLIGVFNEDWINGYKERFFPRPPFFKRIWNKLFK